MAHSTAAMFAALVLVALPCHGQESAGTARVGFLGYYMGQGEAPLSSTTGSSLEFSLFVPKTGLFRGSFQGYGYKSGYRMGETFLELSGFRWRGRLWTLTGGDFRMAAHQFPLLFSNIYDPELASRGVRIEAATKSRAYGLFFGQVTLTAGPRIPFRILAPQRAAGAYFRQNLGERLQLGLRYTNLWSRATANSDMQSIRYGVQGYDRIGLVAGEIRYTLSSHWRLNAEVTGSLPDASTPAPYNAASQSVISGSTWESPRIRAQANYVSETAAYRPIHGFYLGDRRGPYAEISVKPLPGLSLNASAAHTSNNLRQDPAKISIESTMWSGGAGATLPWKFSLSAQASTIGYQEWKTGEYGPRRSENRMVNASLNRPIGRHSLRMTYRDMNLVQSQLANRQRAAEVGDVAHFGRFLAGGSVRLQTVQSGQRQASLYYTGYLSFTARRFGLNASLDSGNDMVNRTVFSTTAYSGSSIGGHARLPGKWDLQASAFRMRLTTNLNPTSLFFLANNGGMPPSLFLSGHNMWNLYFSLTREANWGSLPQASSVAQLARTQATLVGAVEGIVSEQRLAGPKPASAGTVLLLDESRRAVTDEGGRYRFEDVPEGQHAVALSAEELLADYNPGPTAQAKVVVRSRRTTRQDLDVYVLTQLRGRVSTPPEFRPDDLVVRLLPGDLYTIPESDGTFAFHNLREGDYQVSLDKSTLPAGSVMKTSDAIPVRVLAGAAAESIDFEFFVIKEQDLRPVRKVFEKRLDEETLQRAKAIARSGSAAAPVSANTDSRAKAPQDDASLLDLPASAGIQKSGPRRGNAGIGSHRVTDLGRIPPSARRQAKPATAAPAEDLNARGRILLAKGRWVEAIEVLSAAIRLAPGSPLPLNARGYAYLRIKRYTDSLRDLDEAIRLNPAYENAHRNRAAVLRAMGVPKTAAPDAGRTKASPARRQAPSGAPPTVSSRDALPKNGTLHPVNSPRSGAQKEDKNDR